MFVIFYLRVKQYRVKNKRYFSTSLNFKNLYASRYNCRDDRLSMTTTRFSAQNETNAQVLYTYIYIYTTVGRLDDGYRNFRVLPFCVREIRRTDAQRFSPRTRVSPSKSDDRCFAGRDEQKTRLARSVRPAIKMIYCVVFRPPAARPAIARVFVERPTDAILVYTHYARVRDTHTHTEVYTYIRRKNRYVPARRVPVNFHLEKSLASGYD